MSTNMQDGNPLAALPTPALILDEMRMTGNIGRLADHLARLGVPLRPHVKTAKSIDVVRRLMPRECGPATVSTLKEAEVLADAGVRDILYAVGIAPAKLDRVSALLARGIDLSIVVDSVAQARAVTQHCSGSSISIPVLVEIDSDGHRSGVDPDDSSLIEIGRILDGGGAELRGVMTHAGASYDTPGRDALERAAAAERDAAVRCANALRSAGLPCPVVSVGSTPTAHFARDLSGVTEVRAGVFVFFDLVMAGIGVCSIQDISLSVLATVIGHKHEKGWIIVDAGWMAMSRDRGTARQAVDQGYGLVCDIDGQPYADLILSQANQEHGVLAIRNGSSSVCPQLPVGTRVRILPNHACATAAQHECYRVLNAEGRVIAEWPRFSGW